MFFFLVWGGKKVSFYSISHIFSIFSHKKKLTERESWAATCLEELGLLQPSGTTANWRSRGGRAKDEVSRKSRACLSCFFGAGDEEQIEASPESGEEAEAVIESREAAEAWLDYINRASMAMTRSTVPIKDLRD